ncbi:pyridoxamine 5'-phosphate oxidase family protein [Nonomuraea sp. 3-1Str]|uniref:pyridoxamine 5'-phosphate oxidase family protein n=1 Tax=Nonomuraea sp. 3-1Str TaxID=2929801 RepID=UPI0028672823|nr:pyridoxamine 5'-phosphate oxidase family protein [Nonomuraea sp. 3-1Str]MDR8413986.1 pyridoxamine 5'-phosphate oxidase family protein [Nonomuraea sp. 3-1Str]
MTPAPPRTALRRKQDVLDRLAGDVDAWVSTAGPDGWQPHLVPLSFLWDGATLLLSTAADSPTGRNLRHSGRVQLGLGHTRDVTVIEGSVETVPPAKLREEEGDAFAVKTGFDPRALSTPYLYFRVTPLRILAWREENELKGRELMREGRWTVA